jgi:hypothetical protein
LQLTRHKLLRRGSARDSNSPQTPGRRSAMLLFDSSFPPSTLNFFFFNFLSFEGLFFTSVLIRVHVTSPGTFNVLFSFAFVLFFLLVLTALNSEQLKPKRKSVRRKADEKKTLLIHHHFSLRNSRRRFTFSCMRLSGGGIQEARHG